MLSTKQWIAGITTTATLAAGASAFAFTSTAAAASITCGIPNPKISVIGITRRQFDGKMYCGGSGSRRMKVFIDGGTDGPCQTRTAGRTYNETFTFLKTGITSYSHVGPC